MMEIQVSVVVTEKENYGTSNVAKATMTVEAPVEGPYLQEAIDQVDQLVATCNTRVAVQLRMAEQRRALAATEVTA
jgi:hypothetical protein